MADQHEEYKKELEALYKRRGEREEQMDEAATAMTGRTGQTTRKALESSGAQTRLLKDPFRRGVAEAEAREALDDLDEEERALDAKYGLRSQRCVPTDLPIPEQGFAGFEDLSKYTQAAAVERSKQEGLLDSKEDESPAKEN